MIGLAEYFTKLKIIISEVDGVLTNGVAPVDEIGNVTFKNFYHKDFEAINLLKAHFKVVFVSADNQITYNMMRRKQIPFYYDAKNKKQAVLQALRRYSLSPDEALYLGSTYSDVGCMEQIPFSMCPEDAVPEAKNQSTTVLPVYGGDGVFCAVYDMLKPEIKRRLSE